MMKTTTPKIQAKSDKKWYLVDATDKVMGRLAADIAVILRGKNKPNFTPHLDMGDYVVVINAEKVKVTGNKEQNMEYIHHTGYWGHLRRFSAEHIRKTNPTRMITQAISGMIPRNRLRKFILAKLSVYAGPEHPHTGQNPITINL